MHPRPATPVAAALAAVALFAAACEAAPEIAECVAVPGGRPCVEVVAHGERDQAPSQPLPTVTGEPAELGLGTFRGRTVVLNFWAAWCGPCRAEQPELNEAHRMLAGEDVAFLGVDIQDPIVNARAHLEEFDVPYPSLFDPDSAYAARFGGIGPSTIPTTVIVDRDGMVATRLIGQLTAEELVVVVAAVDRLTPP